VRKGIANQGWLVAAVIALSASSSAPARAPQPIGYHRIVKHTKAYSQRPELGEYVAIKVTPPEKRGKAGKVLVEVFNYTKSYLSVMQFDLNFTTNDLVSRSSTIVADDIKPNWSALRWIDIPSNEKLPPIQAVSAAHLTMIDDTGKYLAHKISVDLIKD
jgi:hypothetical protein